MKLAGKIPFSEKMKAIWSIFLVIICYSVPWALTFVLAPLVILTAKRTTNAFGETTQPHNEDYIRQGASGIWYYVATAVKWLTPWNNYEDGLNGEPSGKHSARVNGKEESFWARYQWMIRNPFNEGKRTNKFFACFVDQCKIEYWGDEYLTDKTPIQEGKYWVRATDLKTGRVYYGYRHVRSNADPKKRPLLAKIAISVAQLFNKMRGIDKDYTNTVYNVVFGFKIRPTHAGEVQGKDDKDKAVTARIQFASTPD